MLAQEFNRLKATFDSGQGVCTLNLTGEKLTLAADRYGIKYEEHHRALDDARVTAELFKKLFEEDDHNMIPVSTVAPNAPACADVVTREAAKKKSALNESLIQQICQHTRFPTSEEKILQYLNILNAILADLSVDAKEQKEIIGLMQTLELSSADIKWANEVYLQTLIVSAKRDGKITEREKNIMDTVADILDVPHMEIPPITEGMMCEKYTNGTRVCFTGTAVDANNEKIKRRILEAEITKKGLQPVGSVTKNGCDLLVAQEVQSLSSKSVTARRYGIEIISLTDFLDLLNGIPTHG